VEKVRTTYVSFFDDDNGLKPNHFAELFKKMKEGSYDLVHSHRMLVFPNGTLYNGDYLPWAKDEHLGKQAVKVFHEHGILKTGTQYQLIF
jgi:hypothetical protein